ncbi:hypothetical protein LSUB1_G002903 [Lachnellula subtilissima]|uniref:F-box domain-containing protein n=1 Tax=Lachnellula subtilissima TaxID=602034 RepID=A0A8H8RXA3_9HELO|nr:hypothetical protein LSUB1_G002903 [Lachnellula subtilissima]
MTVDRSLRSTYDIQILIIPYLDFTSLISLAQTTQLFRDLINPQRRHFVGRLLEIECLPQNGGEVTLDLLKVFPPTVRYACTRCLKILPHTKFDNHALLRLRFRKPPPKSRAGKQLCSWTSGYAKAQGLKRQGDLANDTFEKWMAREHPLVFAPTPELKEEYNIGICRHRRTCNECKFQSGFWAQNFDLTRGWRRRNGNRNQNVGTAVPVIKSRQVYTYHDASERFFPGLFPYTGDFPARRRIYRDYLIDRLPWCLYTMRCPGCERWQEFAAFRQPRMPKSRPRDAPVWDVQDWDVKVEEWRCNGCVAAADGEQELGRQLVELWKTLAGWEVKWIDYCLVDGWRHIGYLEHEDKDFSWTLVYRRARVESQLLREVPNVQEIAKMSGEVRREIYGIWKQYLQKHGEWPEGDLITTPWFKYWSYGYEAMEKRAEFLRACTDRVEADPGILVEYALRGEGYEAMVMSY